MGLSFDVSNKLFFVVGVIFQLWFILMYAIDYRYIFYPLGDALGAQSHYGFMSVQGFLVCLFLFLLFFLGFTLVNTYVAGSAYSTALFSFLVIVFTIQYYFIIKSFWIGVGLGNDNYNAHLAKGTFSMIRLSSNDYRLFSSLTTNVGMTEAIVCSLSMLIAYMAIAGRVGGFQVFILCFFGVFFYSFNETVIWRHAVADNGYTLRLFLFGSTFGIMTGIFLRFKDKIATTESQGYLSIRHTRMYALLGTCFVWLFLPILSCVNQIYDSAQLGFSAGNIITYLYPSILNSWFALSASCTASYCVSILLGRKIHPHDIVFSSFTGGIAYGCCTNINPDPFPAILCGLIVGIITTIFNHKLKKPLNNPEVIDTQGTLFTFFTAALIGGFYSGILEAVFPYGPDVPNNTTFWAQVSSLRWLPPGRSKIGQGAIQIAGTFISVGIGMLSSLATGLILYFTTQLSSTQVFSDATFTQVTDQPQQSRQQNRQ